MAKMWFSTGMCRRDSGAFLSSLALGLINLNRPDESRIGATSQLLMRLARWTKNEAMRKNVQMMNAKKHVILPVKSSNT